MSIRLIAAISLSKCLRNNAVTKAYQLTSKVPSLKMASGNCGRGIIPNLYSRKLSTTTENTADDGEKTDQEPSVLPPKEYTDAEIQAVFDGAEARNVPKNGSQVRTVPLETSIKYLESQAFFETYGDEPVWKQYRRNHKGGKPPVVTRKSCIRKELIATGNPCPICRDDFLVVSYRNVKLLNQFISQFSGEIITFTKTGVCQKQHLNIITAIYKAKDYGLIKYNVPFKKYNYANYYPELEVKKSVS